MTTPLAESSTLEVAVATPRKAPRRGLPREEEDLLVQRMLAGDEAAFDEFADTYIPALYRFANRRLDYDRELTQDIVQTTIVKAISNLRSFRGEAALMTWLCACCRMEIAAHFRRQQRVPRIVELNEVHAPSAEAPSPSRAEGPERHALRHESEELVHMALDLLPDRQAKALELKYLKDLPVKEIAVRLGTTPKAVESLLTRARESFRDHFGRLFTHPITGRIPGLGGGQES